MRSFTTIFAGLTILLLIIAAGPALATWNWTSSSPAIFEFADNDNSSYNNPNKSSGPVYTTTANDPNLYMKQQYTSGGTWVHQFSTDRTGSLSIRTNGGTGTMRSICRMRGQAGDGRNCETFRTSVPNMNWTNGLVIEVKAKSVGDMNSANWPPTYTWGGTYGVGGVQYNFWNLEGAHSTDNQDSGMYLVWPTNNPTTTADDRASVYNSANTAVELYGVNYSLWEPE